MAFKSRLKCLFLKPIFCILFATFLHFARNTTSANAFEEDKKKAFDVKMNDYITKPIDFQKMEQVLKHILSK